MNAYERIEIVMDLATPHTLPDGTVAEPIIDMDTARRLLEMTETIEFEVPAEPKKIRLCSHVNCDGKGSCEEIHDTTLAEFDAVARERGYVKLDPTPFYELLAKVQIPEDENNTYNTFRRIIAERDKAHEITRDLAKQVADCDRAIAELSTCALDGVTYRGNEGTIGKLEQLNRWYTNLLRSWREVVVLVEMTPGEHQDSRIVAAVADLKRQLAEAKEQSSPPIPDKWRKAIELSITNRFTETDPIKAILAISSAANKAQEEDRGSARFLISKGISIALNWLAAELEKQAKGDG